MIPTQITDNKNEGQAAKESMNHACAMTKAYLKQNLIDDFDDWSVPAEAWAYEIELEIYHESWLVHNKGQRRDKLVKLNLDHKYSELTQMPPKGIFRWISNDIKCLDSYNFYWCWLIYWKFVSNF